MRLYSSKLEEVKALERLCGVWDFWSSAQLIETFKSYPNRIYYLPGAGTESLYFEAVAIFIFGDSCELLYIYTLPAKRGQGLGRNLLQAAVDDLRQSGTAQKILLEVRPSNHKAIDLYEVCGFKRYGERQHYYSDGEDAILMKLDWTGV